MKIASRQARSAELPKDIDSVDGIVEHLLSTLSAEDLAFIKDRGHDYGMVGRYIRNTYGLWAPDHPLTTNWSLNEASRVIINGADCSPDHPDNLTGQILKLLKERL